MLYAPYQDRCLRIVVSGGNFRNNMIKRHGKNEMKWNKIDPKNSCPYRVRVQNL